MIGHEPFGKELTPNALKVNLKMAIAKVRFVDNQRMSFWRCPGNTQGRYVRIQLEGFNTLRQLIRSSPSPYFNTQKHLNGHSVMNSSFDSYTLLYFMFSHKKKKRRTFNDLVL
jgi:hypothetical protein